MRYQTHHIFSYELMPLEDVAELEPLVDDVSGSEAISIHPYAVPFESVPEIEGLPEEGSELEAAVFALDHVGVSTALSILSPRERQILAMKEGLDESGASHSSAEIAASFGLSIDSVSSTLTRARNRLRAVPNILDIINGEDIHNPNVNPLQTS